MGVKIIVIDNGGQYCHRIMRSFQDYGAEAEVILNTTNVEDIQADGMAFSGSGFSMEKGVDPMRNCKLYLDKFDKPILAMCAGHQLIAMHFGGRVGPAKVPEFGKTEIIVDKHGGVFKNLPERFTAWNSHNDEVTELSAQLEVLAHSKDCKYEAIKHKEKAIFGLQFHPEVQHTEYRELIFKNFIELCKLAKL